MFNKELRQTRKSLKEMRKQLRNRAKELAKARQGRLPYIQAGQEGQQESQKGFEEAKVASPLLPGLTH